jgi:hypothetical protein
MTIEGVCKYLSIGGKTLSDKLKNLEQNGFLNKELAQALENHKFLGNEALHRMETPGKEELKVAIELLELTFESIFGIPERRKVLNDEISKRISK